MQKITMSEWRKAIELLNTKKAHRPPGGKTLHEIAREIGKSLPTTYRHISLMLENGKAKMVPGTAITVQNIERTTPYYILTKDAGK